MALAKTTKSELLEVKETSRIGRMTVITNRRGGESGYLMCVCFNSPRLSLLPQAGNFSDVHLLEEKKGRCRGRSTLASGRKNNPFAFLPM